MHWVVSCAAEPAAGETGHRAAEWFASFMAGAAGPARPEHVRRLTGRRATREAVAGALDEAAHFAARGVILYVAGAADDTLPLVDGEWPLALLARRLAWHEASRFLVLLDGPRPPSPRTLAMIAEEAPRLHLVAGAAGTGTLAAALRACGDAPPDLQGEWISEWALHARMCALFAARGMRPPVALGLSGELPVARPGGFARGRLARAAG